MKSAFKGTDAVTKFGELRWLVISGASYQTPTEPQILRLLPYYFDLGGMRVTRERTKWIADNCDGVWTVRSPNIYFEFEHDAILFRLACGLEE